MATIFPGAIWLPIPVSPSRPRRSKGRAVIYHVAVSESLSLFGLFSSSPNDSHLYVRRDGTIEQYVDLDLVAYASMDANASTISVETQGGVTNADVEPWTAEQVASLARIARWAHDTEGVPLQVMPNSLAASKGIGFHRLGIDPWRVSGGEVWSSSRGKLCPGAGKIAQVPQIIAAAISGSTPQEADLTPDEHLALMQVRDYLGANGGQNSATPDTVGYRVRDIQLALTKALPVLVTAAQSPPATADPQALADAVVAAMGSEFAQKVIDALGQRINQTQPPAAS